MTKDQPISSPSQKKEPLIKILGAGYGRTGTLSLCLALDQLGYNTHHMAKVITDPSQDPDLFRDAYLFPEDPVDWDNVFKGYDAAVDWPAVAFFEKLLKEYPDAKVILTERDPDQWYTSASKTIREWPGVDDTWPEHILRARRMAKTIVCDGELRGKGFQDKQRMIDQFTRHSQRVKEIVRPENLLVMQLGEGWSRLCAFLGKEVPDLPWPHANKGDDFEKLIVLKRDQFIKNMELASRIEALDVAK
ncbi:P-loop containing nucleoside triphosphate hydrolase protein [Phycomyces blakesleeanus]